jgi:hypothetical protein
MRNSRKLSNAYQVVGRKVVSLIGCALSKWWLWEGLDGGVGGITATIGEDGGVVKMILSARGAGVDMTMVVVTVSLDVVVVGELCTHPWLFLIYNSSNRAFSDSSVTQCARSHGLALWYIKVGTVS